MADNLEYRKSTIESVGKYDPRRVMPGYAYQPPLEPSDIGRAGAKYFFEYEMPKSEARDRVKLASPSHPVVRDFRRRYPMYDDMDDESFMDAVVAKFPKYSYVIDEIKQDKERLYRKIDKIEYKKSVGAVLDPDEAYINLMAIPDSRNRVVQSTLPHYLNARTFGFSSYVLNRMGLEGVQPETPAESVGAAVSSLIGFIQSPMKLATSVASSIPGLNAIFAPINASSRMQLVLKPLLRGGIVLGAAGALMLPQDAYKKGIIQPGERVQQFGNGFMYGAASGGLSFIPNRASRMISTSLFFGVPSTMREDSLEEQIFNYGLGAYMGFRGVADTIKSEKQLLSLIESGVSNPDVIQYGLERNNQILGEFKQLITSEGQPFTDILRVGKYHYEPVFKHWRSNTIKVVTNRLRQLKKERTFKLRNDKVTRIFEALKRKPINKLTNAELYNLNEHLKPENTPPAPSVGFVGRPVTRPEYKSGRSVTLFHNFLRLGYSSMEHLGFGGLLDNGLTGQVFKADVKGIHTQSLHRHIVNNWKRMVGTNPRTARRIFLYLDGKLDLKRISRNHPEYTKEYKVAQQMRQYLDILLELQNRHRAKYGLEPIKPLKNYITHLFDAITSAKQSSKYPQTDIFADLRDFIAPGQSQQPYLQTRKGARGYQTNIWVALDAYGYRASDYISDDGLRHTKRMIDFVKNEIRINDEMGKVSPIHWENIQRNLVDWSNRYAGSPGKLDVFINNSFKRLPPSIKGNIRSAEQLFGIWRTLHYVGAMGWRPKLALRNLGQHSLIIGEVGPKMLWKAINTRNTPEARRLLLRSEVLKTRELGFAPEIPHTTGVEALERARNSAFWMFRQADRINVEDAFLAGYYEGKSKNWGERASIKRGDEVAALTQFLYTKGNRGPISDLWGLSHNLGRTASMFTTWPINKIELDLSWARPGHRVKMTRYLGLCGLSALAGLAAGGKVRTSAYTGFGAEMGIVQKFQEGIIGIRNLARLPKIVATKDVHDGLEDGDLWKLILYDIKKNTPFWERF